MPVDLEYYELLGVAPDSDGLTIKKAYRRLAVLYHPDKNPDQAQESSVKFQQIGEAYQVLSNPDLRSKYDKFGKEKAIPEQGFEDASDFFECLFGGEAFRPIIGEISLIKDMSKAFEMSQKTEEHNISSNMAITENSHDPNKSQKQKKKKGLSKEQQKKMEELEQERKKKRKERVDTLTETLVNKLSVLTESDGSPEVIEAFKEKIRIEAESAKMESFGCEILHAVGYTYMQKASMYLNSQKLKGIGSFFSKMKEMGVVAKDTWSTISSALDVYVTAEKLEKMQEMGGDDWTPEKKAELERDVTGKILIAGWKATKFEIQDVLRDVCSQVFADPSVPKAKKIQRAQAMIIIGSIYRSVKPDLDDPNRVFELLMMEAMTKKNKTKKS